MAGVGAQRRHRGRGGVGAARCPVGRPDVPIELLGVNDRRPGRLDPAHRAGGRRRDHAKIADLPVTTQGPHGLRPRAATSTRSDALARLDALMWNQTFSIDEVLALAEAVSPCTRCASTPRAAPTGRRRGRVPARELDSIVLASTPAFRVLKHRFPCLSGGACRWHSSTWVGANSWSRSSTTAITTARTDAQYVKDIARLRMLEALGLDRSSRVIAEDERPRTQSAGASGSRGSTLRYTRRGAASRSRRSRSTSGRSSGGRSPTTRDSR